MVDTLDANVTRAGSATASSIVVNDDGQSEKDVGDVSSSPKRTSAIPAAPASVTFVPEAVDHIDNHPHSASTFAKLGDAHRLAFKQVRNDAKLVKLVLHSYGFCQASPTSNQFNLMWTGAHLKPHCYRALQHWQRINHFPRSFELTRKDRLYRNIEKMALLNEQRQLAASTDSLPQQTSATTTVNYFNFIPEFYVCPDEIETLRSACSLHSRQVPYIVKPVGLSRGRGIFLATHPDEIPLASAQLVSRYIEKPLLLNGLKFDIRLYVAVTSFNPLVAYLYQDGLVRFATEKYSSAVKDYRLQTAHLTNYSVNKQSQRFIRNGCMAQESDGHKWTLGGLLRTLSAAGHDTKLLMLRIEDVCIKTLLSAQCQISAASRAFVPYDACCFELFGFDVLLDDHLKPWLLEVNLSPSLTCDSPLDVKVKTSLLCDLLTLADIGIVDPVRHAPVKPGWQGRLQSKAGGGSPPDSSKRSAVLTRARLLKRRAMLSSNSSSISTGSAAGAYGGGSRSQQQQALWSRALSHQTRTRAHYARYRRQRRRCGGFVPIFPRQDTHALYSALMDDVGTDYDECLHDAAFGSTDTENEEADGDASDGGSSSQRRASQSSDSATQAQLKLYHQCLMDCQHYTKLTDLPKDISSFMQHQLAHVDRYAGIKQWKSKCQGVLPRLSHSIRKRTKSCVEFERANRRRKPYETDKIGALLCANNVIDYRQIEQLCQTAK